MKKQLISLLLVSSVLFSSCIGSFSAFHKVLDWNKNVTKNKFANELIFLALYILPVYSIAMLADLVVLNSIEFWTGNNPLSMKEGEIKIETVESNGKTYQVTTTKNKVTIKVVKGENVGNSIDLVYNTEDNSWNYVNKEGKTIKLADYKEGVQHVYLPNNKVITIDANTSKTEKLAIIDQKLGNYNLSKVYSIK